MPVKSKVALTIKCRRSGLGPACAGAMVALVLTAAVAASADDEARVRLTTESAAVQSCSFLATVSDNEVKDLRKFSPSL